MNRQPKIVKNLYYPSIACANGKNFIIINKAEHSQMRTVTAEPANQHPEVRALNVIE